MGLRGTVPTPTVILEARGSRAAEKRKGEPKFEPGIGPCPKWLSKEAKAEWKLVVEQLDRVGMLQRVDRAMLAAYCDAAAELAAIEKVVQDLGGVKPGLKYLSYKSATAKRLVTLAAHFGFSPAARTRLRAGETGDDGDDKLRAFIPE